MPTQTNKILSGMGRALATRLRVGGKAERQIAVVETLGLGGRSQVVLVRVGTQHIAVGLGANGVQCMLPIADEAIVATHDDAGAAR